MSMPNIDWNEVWQGSCMHHAKPKHDGKKFWDKRAPEFTRAVAAGDYVEQFMALLRPDPEWSVLDMGCAAGTLAVPLAKEVGSVTAVDPSSRMREMLQDRCDGAGLTNVRVVEGRWQDDWEKLGIGRHDVVIGSRSLIVDDLKGAVIKAHRFARKKVFLSALVGEGPHDGRIIKATGRKFKTGADYIVVLNLLRQLGIFANVAFTYNERDKTFADLDDALEGVRWMVHEMTDEEEANLRDYLAKALVEENGRLRLPDQGPVRWAVLYWDKKTGCDSRL